MQHFKSKALAGLAFVIAATTASLPASGAAPSSIYRDWSLRYHEKVTVARIGTDQSRGTTTLTVNNDGTWAIAGGPSGTWQFANAAETKVAVTLSLTGQAAVEQILEDWAAEYGLSASVTVVTARLRAKFTRDFTKLRMSGAYKFAITANGKTRRGVYITVDKGT